MHYHVMAKQENSKMCLVCGLKNPLGLKAFFYELDNRELLGVFRPQEGHQSYPGRLHGGISTAILDETIGRAIRITHPDIWGVSIELTTRFRQPVPLNQELRVVGRITRVRSRTFEGSGEILLEDGTVAVEATGKFIRLTLDQIADFDYEEQEWRVTPAPDDPEVVEL